VLKIFSKAISYLRASDTRTIYLNEDGSILSLNDKLAKKKGYNPTLVVGKSYSHLSAGLLNDEKYYQELLETAKRRGTVKYTALTTENGKSKKTEILLEVVKDENHSVIGYTVTL
jgi:PAS domain S-box-containing protein